MEHLIIFVGCSAVMVAASMFHEIRNTLREAREITRHDQVVRELRDMRALTLGAVSQRTNIEVDVRDLRGILTDHANVLDELRPTGHPAARPRPA